MIILVYVVEASGLNYPNHKIVITASIGRNVLETKVSSPKNTTRFDSNLAWKTDINSIKRLKSDNVPIKVECFCIGKDGLRELVGFVVLPLRSVSILAGNKVLNITPKWHRLIGLRQSWKTLKPEIFMFISITDTVGVQIINEMRNTTSTATKNMLVSQQGIHIGLNKDEQYIQIGNSDSDCHRFTIEILWLHCEWLSYLTENPSSEGPFHLRYTLLDCPTEERNLPKMYGTSDEERYLVQEKITIQLRSSLQMIRMYFENVFYVPIYIYSKNDILGRVFFKIESALPDTSDLNDFLVLTKDNTFVAISESFIYPTKTNNTFIDEGHRPALKYNFTLKYHPPHANENKNLHENDKGHEQPFVFYHEPNENHHQQQDNNQISVEYHQKYHPFCDTKARNEVDENLLPTSREIVEHTINTRNQLIERLLHSQIESLSSAKDMENVRFVDVVTPPPVSPDLHRHSHDRIDSPIKIDNVRFVDVATPVPLEMYSRSPKKSSTKIETDLIAWKAEQQESFLMDLKKKENDHLMSLAKEWFIRQKEEEQKLASKMKNCKLLTQSLEHALNAIKEKKSLTLDQQKFADVMHLEQKNMFEGKISVLTDKIRQSEIDHDYQLKIMELKLKEMEMCRRFTSDENEKLKIRVNKLEEENQFLRERNRDLDSTLSRQLQSVEMKLKHAQELELFYKNKWIMADAKLNDMRTTKLINSPQTYTNLSARVVEVLNSVRSDLEVDKFELQSIKDMLE